MPQEITYKVGDWVFFDFELHQITRMDGDRVTGVTNGFLKGASNSFSDRVFPLDLRIKVISDNFLGQKEKLMAIRGANLNFPDIVRWLSSKWADTCREKDNTEVVNTAIRELDAFAREIRDACESLGDTEIGGVRIFR